MQWFSYENGLFCILTWQYLSIIKLTWYFIRECKCGHFHDLSLILLIFIFTSQTFRINFLKLKLKFFFSVCVMWEVVASSCSNNKKWKIHPGLHIKSSVYEEAPHWVCLCILVRAFTAFVQLFSASSLRAEYLFRRILYIRRLLFSWWGLSFSVQQRNNTVMAEVLCSVFDQEYL